MNGSRMHDGWEYVAAAYATTVVVFGVWFAMIGAKLAKQRRNAPARDRQGATGATTQVGGDD